MKGNSLLRKIIENLKKTNIYEILNVTSENEKLTFKRKTLRQTIDFWVQEWKLKDKWECLFKFLKGEKKLQPQIVYPTKISFKREEKDISENIGKFHQQ